MKTGNFYNYKTKYKKGDMLKITEWDTGNECYKEGISIVKKVGWFQETIPVYYFTYLSGDFNATKYNAIFFDQEAFVETIGNIDENPALKVLYGKA